MVALLAATKNQLFQLGFLGSLGPAWLLWEWEGLIFILRCPVVKVRLDMLVLGGFSQLRSGCWLAKVVCCARVVDVFVEDICWGCKTGREQFARCARRWVELNNKKVALL